MKITPWLLALFLTLLPAGAPRAQEPPLTTPLAAPRLRVPGDTAPVWLYLERRAGIFRAEGAETLCPVYRLTVFGDGRVRYVGEAGVRVRGERWARVPVRELVACINAAARQGFFEWAPTGPASARPRLEVNWEGRPEWKSQAASDSPAVAIQIGLGGEQTWRGEPSAPEWFERLARRIEDVVGVERWTKPPRVSARRHRDRFMAKGQTGPLEDPPQPPRASPSRWHVLP